MKKLIKKLLIFCIPFALALALFFAFETYDFWGLKGDAIYLSRPLSVMRELKREQPANIILGDSRMANIDADYVSEITGEPWHMMGFGGAQMGECVELFWWANEHTDLQKVVFGVSFYTVSGEQGPGRIPEIIKRDDPWTFMTNANYWLEAINSAKQQAMNLLWRTVGHPERQTFPEDPTGFGSVAPENPIGVKYRTDLEDYCAILKTNMENFSLQQESLDRLQEVIDYCEENGIELIFVFPPMQECVFELVTEPLGIEDDIETYKSFLAEQATVYDFETKNSFTCDPDNFYDGFHLSGEGKRQFIDAIFLGADSDMVTRYEVEP